MSSFKWWLEFSCETASKVESDFNSQILKQELNFVE